MSEQNGPTPPVAPLELGEQVVAALRSRLALVAERTANAVTTVPSYSGAITEQMRGKIEYAVEIALGAFLNLIEQSRGADPGTPLAPAVEAAYQLGGGEAREGRSMDALLAAYRVGARAAWREMSASAVRNGLSAEAVADFAQLMFAYIDELSAASVAGHADQLATAGRMRRRYLERLTRQLLAAEPEEVLRHSAARADWPVPETLTAVLVPRANLHSTLALLSPHTLEGVEDLPVGAAAEDHAVLLVPDMHGGRRAQLTRLLHGRRAILGPARAWSRAAASFQRAVRATALAGHGAAGDAPLDTEEHLAELVLRMDPEGLADLRARVLAPLAALPPATAARLAETLRAWLLHQGRRDDVAAALFVHPQTVRYRLGKIRELYGARLDDPATVLDLTLALAIPADPTDTAGA